MIDDAGNDNIGTGEEGATPAHSRKRRTEFGHRLHEKLLSLGWTQSDLARRADIKRNAVYTYINGISQPTEESLLKIATALRMKPEDLMPDRTPKGELLAPFELRGATPGHLRLIVDKVLPEDVAFQIFQLIREAEANASNKRK